MTEAELELLLAALPAVVQEGIRLYEAAKGGTIDLSNALAQAAAMQTSVTTDNAAANAAVAAKFPTP